MFPYKHRGSPASKPLDLCIRYAAAPHYISLIEIKILVVWQKNLPFAFVLVHPNPEVSPDV
jgi:hypothetical protein